MNLAWHFVGETLRDGTPVPADGEWLEFDGEPEMCESGLHFSRDPFDALQYAPGNVLCRVDVNDITAEDSDKGVCRRRRIIKRRNIEQLLRLFARDQAMSVIRLWDAPDIVRRYLETGNVSLRAAALDAARAAVRAAVRAAARAAVRAAARAAVRAAVGAAARDVAWAAAWEAAWAAAWDATASLGATASWAAAWDAKRKQFNDLVAKEFGE